MNSDSPLLDFHPVVRRWFEQTFGEPSPPQTLGWPSISSGNNTLILAPTGSGKTLAAFLWAINHLVEQHLREEMAPGVRILYVSPLKALNNDIARNLDRPLAGIKEEAHRAGLRLPPLRAAVRTGDTPQAKRAAMAKHPPDILITTPESLYLILTSKQTRRILRTVQYVVVDEIHSICGNKRGVHLSLSLERLSALADQDFVRIGLSATQRPLEQIAAFLAGYSGKREGDAPRPVTIIDAGRKKYMDLRVVCAAPDLAHLPQDSVWPLVFTELLENIRSHNTTLIFANNRRLAERIAAKLNEMIVEAKNTLHQYAVPQNTQWEVGGTAGSDREPVGKVSGDTGLVQAYHGSMSRQARERMEADLKGGQLRALVATSSLELGIDIGSIDLVIQVQSPKGVARGLQRVGRSGHVITATSKGRIFPTNREDLVETAVIAKSMLEHDVEQTAVPVNCLDVLAQQIVAMVSVEEWNVDDLFRLVKQSYCYRDLPRKLYLGVLQMLAGRYTHETFRDLRPRISWDRVNNVLRALPGSGHLATTSGGTITDRGYYGVFLEDGKTKIGEVDEEFVYESRTGDTFILGTHVWQIVHIEPGRLSVIAAPGQPARMPFWRGEGIGRSFETGERVGAFRREMNMRIDSPDCLVWLQREYPIDSRTAWNIQEYFRKQHDTTGTIPTDRLLLVEGFCDEIGDPRIVVHTPFGRRVNGLIGLVLSDRLERMVGVEPQMLYNDNGILLRCSDLDALPLDLLDGLSLAEAEEVVLRELLTTPLFGGQFRQNAARALLIPKSAARTRTPLWLQRLRAADLLQIARQFDDFPIVIETVREVLHEILDFDHFKEVLRRMEQGVIQTRVVRTEFPSPFAASLLFDFLAVYMYETDQPRADRQSQYLAINREILSEVVDIDSIQSLLRPEAIDTVEQQLQRTANGYRARSPEELLEILLRVGDLTQEEIEARCVTGAREMIHGLEKTGQATRLKIAGNMRWVAGEEKSKYQDLASDRNAHDVFYRYLQFHGPATPSDLAQRYGISPERIPRLISRLVSSTSILSGHFRPQAPGEREIELCYRPNIEKIHRQTIAILRKEIKPSTLAHYTHFLLRWQHLLGHEKETGMAGLELALAQLQGIPLPQEIWERDILRKRVPDYTSDLLHRVLASGSVVWVGAGPARARAITRGEGSSFLPAPASPEEKLNEPGRRILAYLQEHGASFFADIRAGSHLSLGALNNGFAELFWGGLITNDNFAELLHIKRPPRGNSDEPLERIEMLNPRHNPHRARIMHSVRRAIRQIPGWSGRWSLVYSPGVMGPPVSPEEQAHRHALQLLDRYGIVARELCRREDTLTWPIVAAELQRMELRGEVRRGYFVEGLSGIQYAHPLAVEELRSVRSAERPCISALLVNACDPANPFGTGIDLPIGKAGPDGMRFSRFPGNYLVFQAGDPIVFLEDYGTHIWTLAETSENVVLEGLRLFTAMLDLPTHMRPVKTIVVEHCDGMRPVNSPLEPVLRSLGFRRDRNQTMRFDGYV